MLELKEYFCPNDKCKHYGQRDAGNLVKAGTYARRPMGSKRQMLQCRVCKHRFSETQSTIFAGSRYSDDTIRSIIVSSSEGVSVRATARILKLSKDPVNKIVLKAGNHAQKILDDLLHSLHLNECQMDELWSFIKKKHQTKMR